MTVNVTPEGCSAIRAALERAIRAVDHDNPTQVQEWKELTAQLNAAGLLDPVEYDEPRQRDLGQAIDNPPKRRDSKYIPAGHDFVGGLLALEDRGNWVPVDARLRAKADSVKWSIESHARQGHFTGQEHAALGHYYRAAFGCEFGKDWQRCLWMELENEHRIRKAAELREDLPAKYAVVRRGTNRALPRPEGVWTDAWHEVVIRPDEAGALDGEAPMTPRTGKQILDVIREAVALRRDVEGDLDLDWINQISLADVRANPKLRDADFRKTPDEHYVEEVPPELTPEVIEFALKETSIAGSGRGRPRKMKPRKWVEQKLLAAMAKSRKETAG